MELYYSLSKKPWPISYNKRLYKTWAKTSWIYSIYSVQYKYLRETSANNTIKYHTPS